MSQTITGSASLFPVAPSTTEATTNLVQAETARAELAEAEALETAQSAVATAIAANTLSALAQASSVAAVAATSTPILAAALAQGTALSSAGGFLSVVLGTAANTAAAGNDSRIVNAFQKDANGQFSNNTIGANFTAAFTQATLQNISHAGLQHNQQINTNCFANLNDDGGGVWVYALTGSQSTLPPDPGITLCPTDLQSPGTASIGTGNGTTVTFSGTLANINSIPQTFVITAGSVTASDDGAGILLIAGAPSGTFNSATGAYSVTFPTAPANAVAITGAYSFASAAGRWIRQFQGRIINAAWFGYGAAANAASAIQAADNFAAAHSCSLFIPTYATNLGFTFNRTITHQLKLASTHVFSSEGFVSGGTVSGTSFVWSPTGTLPDLTPMIVPSSNYQVFENITGAGVVSYSNNGTDILPVGTINYAAAGDMTNYANVMPYSAIASGLAFFQDGYHTTFINCGCSTTFKVGLVLQSATGHTTWHDCNWNGLAGIYALKNAENYTGTGAAPSGVLCGLMLNDVLVADHYGGFGRSSITSGNADFYGSLFAVLQVAVQSPQPASCGGIYESTFQVYSEALGEALFRLLPYSSLGTGFSYAGPGPTSAGLIGQGTNPLPSNWLAAAGQANPIQQAMIWTGTCSDLNFEGASNNYGGGGGAGSGTFKYSMILQGAGASGHVFANEYSERQLGGQWLSYVNVAGSTLVNFQPSTTFPSFYNAQSRSTLATKDILQNERDFLPQGSLLNNPEVIGNWSGFATGNAAFAVETYSAAIVAGVALPAITTLPPDAAQQMGNNPVVYIFSQGTGTNVSGNISISGQPLTINAPTNIGVYAWVYSNTTANLNFFLRISTNVGGQYLYNTATVYHAGLGWQKILLYANNAQQNTTAASYVQVQFFTATMTGSGNFVAMSKLMAFTNEVTAPNPLLLPYARKGLAIGNEPGGVASSAAPNILAGIGAPSGAQPNSTLYLRTDGATGTRLYVSNGATWTAVSGV